MYQAADTDVVGLSEATYLSVGRDHSCIVDSDHRVQCWGQNEYGQLGDGTTSDRTSPTPTAFEL